MEITKLLDFTLSVQSALDIESERREVCACL